MQFVREQPNLQMKVRYSQFFYSPSWELERRRKAMNCFDEKLIEKNVEINKKKENLKIRLENIEKRIEILEDIFPYIKNYTKEFKRKHETTIVKINNEEQKNIKIKYEIKQLKMKLDYLINLKQNLIVRLNNFKIFKDYLNFVCLESNGKFKTIAQLLDHFHFLLDTRYKHITLNQKYIFDIEERRNHLILLTPESNREELEYQNTLIKMKKKQNELQIEFENLEVQFTNLKTTISHKILEPNKLKLSIYNLYSQMCEILGTSLEINSSDFHQQLNFIQDAIKQIEQVRNDVHRNVLSPNSLNVEVEDVDTSTLLLQKK